MQTFEFTPEEVEILRDILQRGFDEMEIEVFHTDTHDFKDLLKRRRQILEHILAKLSAAPIHA